MDEERCLDEKIAGCDLDADIEECPETGVKSISHPSDCGKYVLCVGGTRIKRSCGEGLHFSRESRNCVQPNVAQCEKSEYTCPEEDDLDNLVFLPNTNDCSSYYVCFGGEPIALTCGDGLHWSVGEQGCIAEADAKCMYGDDDTESCPDEGIMQISHPDSCEKYILCMGGSGIDRACAPGFHFSRDFRTCVPPAMADCE